MITAGIDVGSLTAKAIILGEDKVLAQSLRPTGSDSRGAGEKAMSAALAEAGLTPADIDYTVATGYGRSALPSADATVTEISCHARGAVWQLPNTRTILDMGGQDCKAIRCDSSGAITDFVMNDKCAAGTGRFIEIMASLFDVSLSDVGPLSLKTRFGATPISSTCVLFAKTEALSLLREGADRNDIIAGVCDALVGRILALLRKVGIQADLAISGGIAKNSGIVKRIAGKTGFEPQVPEEPQVVGALGAALFAKDFAAESGQR